jgi:UDP-glucose 4-epimerase
MRALVTGVAGFVGSTLAERLVERGADVVGIDCFTDYYPRPVKERNIAGLRRDGRFRFVEARIQTADLANLLRDRTHVFHLAAQAGVRKSWGRDFAVYTENNIEATQVLLEACTKVALDRIVYASSSSVYGDDVPMPFREDALPQPVSVRRVEACGGTALLPVSRELRAGHCCASLFHRIWAAPAAGHGLLQISARDDPR